jgi:hypothetical protein
MSYSGLRPIKVKADVPRYGWIAQPLYRARIVEEALARREQLKKKNSGF